MKTHLLTLVLLLATGWMSAQIMPPFVSVYNINYVSPTDLANCNDSSAYLGDTVITRGIVVVDGALSEVASGSVQGGNRPFIFIVDTAAVGSPGPWKGIEVMGVYQAGSNFVVPSGFTQVVAGDIVQLKVRVEAFNNSNQLTLVDANSFSVVGSANTPTSVLVPLASLNDPNRINKLETGEQWEGSFIELQNVTVTEVIPFSGNRISFNVVDAQGNKLNVSDRFLAQKLPSWTTVNPNSPQTTGSFIPPVVGTFYSSLKGIVRHDRNGCLGGNGRGYELNPFLPIHYTIGFSPPFFSNVLRDPMVPTSNQSPEISCNITDSDGSVDSIAICWSANPNLAPSQFPRYAMQVAPGSTDDFLYFIPNQPNSTFVRYYIYAKDNDGNESFYPPKPVGATEPNVEFYTVRDDGMKIYDIQYTLEANGNSPFLGRTVTTKGIVTASTKQFDLGYLYLQDEGGSEWSGIWCVGIGLSDFFRDEEVQVTGIVEEYFGHTRLNVQSAQKTGKRATITPTAINPSDSAAYANFGWEKWEGVLVRYQDPQNQKLHISQTNLGFGDYAVSNQPNAPIRRSGRILAGRQSSTSFSSLFVQLVTDTIYQTLDGFMNVDAIAVSDTMNMDAVEGIIFYGFSQYRLLPRNNDDFIGINLDLDSTNLQTSPISVPELGRLQGVKVYPNPARDWVYIAVEDDRHFQVQVFDMNGRLLISAPGNGSVQVNVSTLTTGMYIIKLERGNQTHFSKLIINP